MRFANIPNRPIALYDLREHGFTREHFAIRRQPDQAGEWRVTGCLPLPWPTAGGATS